MQPQQQNSKTVKKPEGTRSAKAVFCTCLVPYSTGVKIQENLVKARNGDVIPDTILFLEHTPVFSMGIRAKEEHLLCSHDFIKGKGLDIEKSNRGGDVTYHGPGQLIVYPIMKLTGKDADAHLYVARLEEVAIKTASCFGVNAFRRKGMTGAWTEQGKIAAIGVHLKRWITFHGMSFNVNVDLPIYDLIVPCGLKKEKVTSLDAIIHRNIPMAEARKVMAQIFHEVFNCDLHFSTVKSVSELESLCET